MGTSPFSVNVAEPLFRVTGAPRFVPPSLNCTEPVGAELPPLTVTEKAKVPGPLAGGVKVIFVVVATGVTGGCDEPPQPKARLSTETRPRPSAARSRLRLGSKRKNSAAK